MDILPGIRKSDSIVLSWRGTACGKVAKGTESCS